MSFLIPRVGRLFQPLACSGTYTLGKWKNINQFGPNFNSCGRRLVRTVSYREQEFKVLINLLLVRARKNEFRRRTRNTRSTQVVRVVRVIRLVSRLFLQKGNRSFGLRFPKNTVKRTAESDDQEICGIMD